MAVVTLFLPCSDDSNRDSESPPNEKPGEKPDFVRLKIPLATMSALAHSPVKWMCYIAWAILNVKGSLTRQFVLNEAPAFLPNDEVVEPDDMLYFVPAEPDAWPSTIDLDVVAARTQSRTNTDTKNPSFVKSITNRDGAGIFTRTTEELCQCCHPSARGTEWLQCIVSARNLSRIDDIDDPANGFLAQCDVHLLLDRKQLAVMVTPNEILGLEDVPHIETQPPHRNPSGQTPTGCQYTLHHLRISDGIANHLIRIKAENGRTATFDNHHDLPSPGLLHYVYGAAVLTQFGTAKSTATWKSKKHWTKPQEQKSSSRPEYNTRTLQDRQTLAAKREVARGPSTSGGGGNDDSGWERKITPDEADNIMFRICMSQLAAKERTEREQNMAKVRAWRGSI